MTHPVSSKQRPAKTTAAMIAEATGFARSTVSHVLNGRAAEMRISKKTTRLILNAANRYGYVANPLARGLRGQPTHAIGVLWSLGGAHSSESVLRPLNEIIARLGCVTYLFDHAAKVTGPLEILRNLSRRGADGVIIQFNLLDVLDAPGVADLIRSFPMRTLIVPEPIDFAADLIVYDRFHAIRTAVNELLAAGRRRFIYSALHLEANLGKAQVVLDTVAAFGQGAVATAVGLGKTTNQDDLPAILDADPRFAEADALLFSIDEFAAAGIRWLQRRGRRCPQDVAVVGFNNSDFARLFSPPLATIDRSNENLAEQLEQLLQNRMNHPESEFQTRQVAMRYIRRDSAVVDVNL